MDRIHKMADFTQRIIKDYRAGNITKDEHDKALRDNGIDPSTYTPIEDKAEITSTTKTAGKQLSSGAGGSAKAEKKATDESPSVRTKPLPQPVSRKPVSAGIPLGLDETPPAGKTGTRTFPGAFGPSNLSGLERYAKTGVGMLGETTGQ